MKRRAFLRTLLTGSAALALDATVDLDRLLWVPKPMVTVPAMPLALRDARTGISIRLVQRYDIQRHVNRLDVLYGVSVDPKRAVRVLSDQEADAWESPGGIVLAKGDLVTFAPGVVPFGRGLVRPDGTPFVVTDVVSA